MQTGLSEPLQTDSLLQYELDAGKGLKVKVGLQQHGASPCAAASCRTGVR